MTMTDGQRLKVALDKAADATGAVLPKWWPSWLVYLLKALQGKTDTEHYEEFLRCVRSAIAARLEDGRW